VINGQGWLYRVDLALGINKYNSSDDGSEDSGTDDDGTDDDGTDDDGTDDDGTTDRRTFISEQVLDTPTLIITSKTDADTGEITSSCSSGVGRRNIAGCPNFQTIRTYLYVEEEQ
jgi:hypothetical protein